LEEIVINLAHLRGCYFNSIIYHQKRLVMKDGLPVERKFLKNLDMWGLPIVAYEPKLFKFAPPGEELILLSKDHRLLIQPFNQEEQDIFNLTLKNRYITYYGTIKD
jgi:hypothetical protein